MNVRRESTVELARSLRDGYGRRRRQCSTLSARPLATTGCTRAQCCDGDRRGDPRAAEGRGRPQTYDALAVAALRTVAEATDWICGKRLAPALPEIVTAQEQRGGSPSDPLFPTRQGAPLGRTGVVPLVNSTNLLERSIVEIKRRTKVIGRLPGESIPPLSDSCRWGRRRHNGFRMRLRRCEMESVRTVSLEEVEATPLQNQGWSRMLISCDHVEGNECSLGVSLYKAGTISSPLLHEVEEVVYVSAGSGELRTNQGSVPFSARQAIFIPPGTWHWVANTGQEDVEMIFVFPSSQYPATQRRESEKEY